MASTRTFTGGTTVTCGAIRSEHRVAERPPQALDLGRHRLGDERAPRRGAREAPAASYRSRRPRSGAASALLGQNRPGGHRPLPGASPARSSTSSDHDPDAFEGPKLAKEDRRRAAGGAEPAGLAELQELFYADGRHRLLVVLQGMDTSGKDGTIRHVFDGVNPPGVRWPASSSRPSASWPTTTCGGSTPRPRRPARSPSSTAATTRTCWSCGCTTSSRRSAGSAATTTSSTSSACSPTRARRSCKFFLHISKDEQAERLQARLDDPTKNWKFAVGDLDERKRWDDYQPAFTEAHRARPAPRHAPWYVVPANRKWYRNLRHRPGPHRDPRGPRPPLPRSPARPRLDRHRLNHAESVNLELSAQVAGLLRAEISDVVRERPWRIRAGRWPSGGRWPGGGRRRPRRRRALRMAASARSWAPAGAVDVDLALELGQVAEDLDVVVVHRDEPAVDGGDLVGAVGEADDDLVDRQRADEGGVARSGRRCRPRRGCAPAPWWPRP